MEVDPYAGEPAESSMLINAPKLVTAYYTEIPDPSVAAQRVSFGTSGHRGSAFDKAFNEWHILVVSQAICLYRNYHKIDGPLFLGMDTHALSLPALASVLEVLAANGVEVMIADKDGIMPALLAAEITAKTGRDPGQIYNDLTREFGEPVYSRVEAPATLEQKKLLSKLSPRQVKFSELAGEKIKDTITNAPGNNVPIGGLKVTTENGRFDARPSGTENIYKIYAESFRGKEHLNKILEEARIIVNNTIVIERHV